MINLILILSGLIIAIIGVLIIGYKVYIKNDCSILDSYWNILPLIGTLLIFAGALL